MPMWSDMPDINFQRISLKDKNLTLKQVTSPKFKGWNVNDVKKYNLHGILFAWARFKLKNTTEHSKTITFTVREETENIYVWRGNNREHFISGDMVSWSKRDGLKDIKEIPFILQPGEEVKVIINLGDISFGNYDSPRIGDYHQIIENKYKDSQIYSADDIITFGFFGFIIFAVIFNFFFYYVNRETVYMVFALMLIASSLLLANEVFSKMLFAECRFLQVPYMFTVVTLFVVMLLHTVRYFFRVNIHFPTWDKFLVYFSIYTAVSSVAIYIAYINRNLIMFGVMATLGTLSILVFLVAAIIMIIKLLRKKDKEARLFVIASMPFILSPIISIAFDLEWIPTVCGVWTILVLSWGMFARFKSLQIANSRAALEREEERTRLIAEQKAELEVLVNERTAELTKSLAELKQTQNQLIQSEKMASLGELTAGIAHEIQNPLNFVNNFSDVSIELLEEMAEELDKGDTEEAKAIAGDVKQNLEKIAHHGRRADGIVKGMLQHSRASSGHMEPTDINSLSDEYLRLAYHGLRAKDKSFNAELVTNFDPTLPKVSAIPQDLGRVLLNMFTNAFYSTQKKQFKLGADYKPVVSITTSLEGSAVKIVVRDNGLGIPQQVIDKIMQPFFTTKPTGEGTGLGLSMSYDIVKAHNGKIVVNSTEGEFAEFIITLDATQV
ncbi:MAG: hypothetical protein EOO45_14965 [Flavobacterium sp.]|nr:MAG: hypothetical protein EOO45_14965 [Flavobacterium sp.]